MRDPLTLNGRIHVFTSALFQTTAVVLEGNTSLLAVDPNYLPEELGLIASFVRGLRKPLRLLYSHHHFDHIVSGQSFPGAEILAHAAFPRAAAGGSGRASSEQRVRDFDDEFYIQREQAFSFVPPTQLVEDGWTEDLGGLRLKLLHHPGHSVDMLATWLPDLKVLLSADMLSPVEIPMLDGDGTVYLESLGKMRKMVLAGETETVVPGHGPILKGRTEILRILDEDVVYIEELQQAVKAADSGEKIAYRFKGGSSQMQKIHAQNLERVRGEA